MSGTLPDRPPAPRIRPKRAGRRVRIFQKRVLARNLAGNGSNRLVVAGQGRSVTRDSLAVMIDKHLSRTALLIDDEAYFRKFVGQVIRKELGSEVREAKDGREGLARFQEARPDFVLLDINMPHMDGLRTLAALRQLSATVPIIMLTSASEETIVEQCVGQGATFFLRKDVPAHQLTAALREALQEFVYGTSA